MRLAFLDVETTGLDPTKHEIIEIAIIVEEGGEIKEIFETKIKPQNLERASPEALEINGYNKNPKAWDSAPNFSEVGHLIAKTLKGCVLVGHNVGFDEEFIKIMMTRNGMRERIPYHKIDTVTLVFEHLKPLGLQRVSLDSIRDFLGWSKFGAHTAMKDVEDTRRLFHLLFRAGLFGRLLLRARLFFASLRKRL